MSLRISTSPQPHPTKLAMFTGILAFYTHYLFTKSKK